MNSTLTSRLLPSVCVGTHGLFPRTLRAFAGALALAGSALLLPGLAQAQTPPPGYYLACQEGVQCVIGPYSKDVAFGTGDGNVVKRVGMTGSFACSTDTFGDPARKKAKYCFISVQESRRYAIAVGGSNMNVNPKQRVWFGVDGRFEDKEVSGNVACDTKTFGDPARGRYKGCFIFQPW